MHLYKSLLITQCNSSRWGSFCKLTCNYAPGHLNAGPPTFFLPRLDIIWHVQTKVVELWSYWSHFFLVYLRDRQLEFWTLFLMAILESATVKYHQWCALPAQKALVTHPPYRLLRYMLLDLPRNVTRSVARLRLCVHTLRFETATCNSTSSPTRNFCEADDDAQDEKHVLFQCTHPQTRSQGVSAFLHQEPTNSVFSFMNLFTLWTG